MSWFGFSDLAKSAISEAQKRIDKVLDIQEDEEASLKASLNKSLDSSISPVSTSAKNDRHLSSSARKSGSQNVRKKGKPMKLGSSLTRSNDTKPRKSNSSTSLNGNLSTNLSQDNFSEISLDPDEDQNILPVHQQEDCANAPNNLLQNIEKQHQASVTVKTASVTTAAEIGEKKENFKLSGVQSFPSENVSSNLNNQVVSAVNVQESRESGGLLDIDHCVEPPIQPTNGVIPSPARDSISITKHHEGNTPATNNPSLHSPCGSTTTSSEIDILDHESTHSETSSASKMNEFDIHCHMIGTESSYHTRMSQDNFDSEASDIVRISGYCSSPLSLDGYENSAYRSPDKVGKASNEELQPSSGLEDEPATLFPPIQHDSSTDDNPQDSISISSEEETQRLACNDENMDDSQSSTVHAENPTIDSITATAEVMNDCAAIDTEVVPETSDEVTTHTVVDATDRSLEEPLLQVSGNVTAHLEEEISQAALAVDDLPKHDEQSPQGILVENEDVAAEKVIEGVSPHAIDEAPVDEKFEHYEQQLVTLSLNNAKLSEENDNLRSEVNNAKLQALNSFESEREEFLKTIDSLNTQLQQSESTNERLTTSLQNSKVELSQRLSNEQVQQLISEKEESIQGLLEEGETLSKKHLQQNNLIKKLRNKASERELSLNNLTEKLSKSEEENQNLKEKLAELKGRSTEDRGTAERLTEAYEEGALRINELVNQLEDSEEKRRAAQSTLDAAYKELAELNKQQVAIESEKEDEIRRREEAVERRMQQELEKVEMEHEHQKHMIHLQMSELRDAVERTEAIATRKEDQWRKEVQDLQQRLQDSELRNHELSEGITESTRPLLRQMENLQATHSAQAKTWEALEKSLTSRLGEGQTQLVAAQDKERTAQMALVELKSRVTVAERQLSDERKNKADLCVELETLRKKSNEFDAAIEKLNRELEMKDHTHAEAMSKARKDRLTLENQLDMEKVRGEVEKKKFQAQYESLQREKEKISWMSRSESMTSASMLNTDVESVGSADTFNHVDAFDRQLSVTGAPSGVYESLRSAASGSSLLENLQAQLKQRDGEIAQLQGEINTLERTRSSMAEEIVRLTNVNEDLEETATKVAEVKVKLQEMKARHDAVLTMYGEKAEEAEELKLDLEDVKAMYRQQIDALLKAEKTT